MTTKFKLILAGIVRHHFPDAKLDGRRGPVPRLVDLDVAGAGDFPNGRGRD
jgi:hypothetical protein